MALNTDRIVWWQASQMDAEGRMTRELLGNGIVTERDYEGATGHLLSIRSGTVASSAVQDVGYEYDHVNNVTHRWDNNLGMSGQFVYDSLDRLHSGQIHHSAAGSPLNQTLAYQYDAIGNLQSRNVNNAPQSYQYDWVNNRYRLINASGVGTMVYDANGNTDGMLLPKDTYLRCRASHDWLEAEIGRSDQPTLVVTHHTPSLATEHPSFRGEITGAAFYNRFDHLIRSPVRAWIHGHTHHSCEARVNGIPVVTNQSGYPREYRGTFAWDRVLQIDLASLAEPQ